MVLAVVPVKWLIQLTENFVFLSMKSEKIRQSPADLYYHSQAISDGLSLPLCEKLLSCQIC